MVVNAGAEERTRRVGRKIPRCLRLHLAHKIEFGKARRKVQFRKSNSRRYGRKQILHAVNSDRGKHISPLALGVRNIAHRTILVLSGSLWRRPALDIVKNSSSKMSVISPA